MRTDLASYILAGVCVVAITVLAGLGQPIPDALPLIATAAVGVGGGAALPTAFARTKATPPAGVDAASTVTPSPAPVLTVSAGGVTSSRTADL